MAILDKKFISRLNEARKKSFQDMLKYRESRKDIVKEYVGDMYGERGADRQVVFNKLQQAIAIYLRLLASDNPQVLIKTEHEELKPFAFSFQRIVNRHLTEVNLEENISRCVLDAMFSIGVMKTGLAAGDEKFEIDGQLYDPGKAFSAPVSLNDFVVDMQANTLEQINFMGDRYLRPKKWVENVYGKEKASGLSGTRNRFDYAAEDRVSGADEHEDKRLYDEVWIWDIYLPKEQILITIPDGSDEPLQVREYEGPERGPYEILGFQFVPDDVMPLPPAMSLFRMHDLINQLMRKQGRQANRQKTVGIFEEGADEDAERIVSAQDGEMIKVMDVDKVREMKMGGADPQNFNTLIWVMQQFDLIGGNLNSLGGLQPQSETATQDKMLSESANALIDSYRKSVLKFTKRIIQRHAWYLWTDPVRTFEGSKPIELTELSVPFTITPEEREGDFLDYNFTVEPFSLREQTPAERSQKLLAILNEFVLPTAEIAMQSGIAPNFEAIARELAEMTGIEFDTLYQTLGESFTEQLNEATPAPPRMAAHTVRTNERVSRSATTPLGNEVNLMQANAGAAPQNAAAGQFQR